VTRTREPPSSLSALVLTEDGSPKAFDTVRLLVKHLLQIVDRQTAVHHIDFEPVTEDHVRRACVANIWKSTEPAHYSSKIALFRVIAGKLMEPGFVFFHFDGDTVWAKQAQSENAAKFRKIVEDGVRRTLELQLGTPRSSRPRGTQPSAAEVRGIIDEAMPRLLPVVPHYSIEAWCLQNTALARELCTRHHQCPSARAQGG
jgi:hypothetical protein